MSWLTLHKHAGREAATQNDLAKLKVGTIDEFLQRCMATEVKGC